jgi:hypothetical protein
MKDKIKEAGFKSILATARYFGVTPKTIYAWINKPPKSVVEHLNLIIRCQVLQERINALESDLNVFKQYVNQ